MARSFGPREVTMQNVSHRIKQLFRIAVYIGIFSLSACTAAITHIPSSDLQDLKLQPPPRVVVADIGDARESEEPTAIAQGFSEWVPIIYYATDKEGKDLPISFYIARSLSEDLRRLGYLSALANDQNERKPVTVESAMDIAREQGADYLVTTKVTDGKTNFWGFLIIPFMEPVWTRIGFDAQLYDVKTGTSLSPEHAFREDTEWYFGKITITDSVIDAGLFGESWINSVWGKTAVSSVLAETAKKVSSEILARQTAGHPAGAI